ncbi:aminopeptidase N [Orussus abietinus]|uniref:aminopeptidase N n=1 Tax=Orussus abietinus TaxID=222816 RepID=UPI0006261F8F|nr:aminopeptidase N [Orussus abietinus]
MPILKISLILGIISLSGAIPIFRESASRIEKEEDESFYRLPEVVVPISYEIKLTPFIEDKNFTYDGESSIQIEVKKKTDIITLHQLDLEFDEDSTKVLRDGKEDAKVKKHSYDPKRQFLNLELEKSLEPGEYTLELKYTGKLNDELNGFYRSSYVNENGIETYLATTHFEPTSARRAFPCWDEPALKATFNISIRHRKDYEAISNMPSSGQEEIEGSNEVWTKFETTPRMSTYLVAFVVSDFKVLKEDRFAVWTKKQTLNSAKFALDFGKKSLEALENFTNITFAISKMDQVAVPHFRAGAMENWGLVTYRETSLLYHPNITTTARKHSIGSVISHEFAHQWFGNLVSPKWWKYLWLNEGFANYFQYFTTDQVEKSWRMMDQLVVKNLQNGAFVADAVSTSHPINQPVGSPSQISKIFDGISYGKAGCVIRMMSHFLTQEVFQDGLQKYLNAKQYDSATSDDLFRALDEAAKNKEILPKSVTVKDIMDTWVEQMGYPLVTVTRDYKTGKVTFEQERFLVDDPPKDDNHDYKWRIPINYASPDSEESFDETSPSLWLNDASITTNIKNLKADDWFIVNKHQTGFYRVNYDVQNWNLIVDKLKSNNYATVPILNRAQLLNDAVNLAFNDQLDFKIFLDLTEYLNHELDYVPWYPTFNGFQQLRRYLVNTESYEAFKTHFLTISDMLIEYLEYEERDDESDLMKFNRLSVLTWACLYGHEGCRQHAEEKLLAWLDSEENVPSPDMKSFILCAGLHGANATIWTKTKEFLYKQDTEDRLQSLSALGCSMNKEILTNFLEQAFDEESTESVEHLIVNSVLISSDIGVNVALDFFIKNAAVIVDKVNDTDRLRRYLTNLGSRITTKDQYNKLVKFDKDHGDGLNITSGAISMAKDNLDWNEQYEPTIRDWLFQRYPPKEVELTTGATTTSDNDVSTRDTVDPSTSTSDDGPSTTDASTGSTATSDGQSSSDATLPGSQTTSDTVPSTSSSDDGPSTTDSPTGSTATSDGQSSSDATLPGSQTTSDTVPSTSSSDDGPSTTDSPTGSTATSDGQSSSDATLPGSQTTSDTVPSTSSSDDGPSTTDSSTEPTVTHDGLSPNTSYPESTTSNDGSSSTDITNTTSDDGSSSTEPTSENTTTSAEIETTTEKGSGISASLTACLAIVPLLLLVIQVH